MGVYAPEYSTVYPEGIATAGQPWPLSLSVYNSETGVLTKR